MKKIFLGLTVILCVSAAKGYSQDIASKSPATKNTTTQANISFKEAENTHDFGTIPQGTPVSYNFTLTNTGKAPLVLSAVNPSCGCTSPEWPKEPIKTGGTAVIKVTYNAATPGTFTKNITVVSNAVNPQTVLYIKGEVKASQQTSAVQSSAPVQIPTPKKS
jgi:hypothetical protein